MRIVPVMNSFRKNNNIKNSNTTKFESNIGNNYGTKRIYTGEASVDLAYASMFDDAIARDLKLMGLI